MWKIQEHRLRLFGEVPGNVALLLLITVFLTGQKSQTLHDRKRTGVTLHPTIDYLLDSLFTVDAL